MTDANTGRQDSADGRGEGGASRATVLLGGGLVAVLLAAVGATGGWLLAGGDNPPDEPLAVASATGAPTTRSTEPRPSTGRTTPSAPRTSASATKGAGLTVPPVVGADFEEARDMLRKQRLGWRLVFGGGTGRTVESASPTVGTEVTRGTTVQLQVAGPPPPAEVPDVVGDDCAKAADELVEEGLYPSYRSGRSGKVSRQEPAEDGPARWNDQVSIWCGTDPAGQPSTRPAF
ncbi:PASTA domain-containing protein [Micromonospora sp. STR1_7]|uniref:PASTA domain-containing protein n=1 Tax=Micromonospora parastrephiae TaxID=2806101 RepID=A0ABS1Y2G4_9ACTN|nr:PASTA domain-containing protein [Micromonospora parastrephiae]MBM0235698.1 PASTA domain-containing protein [Micromonospora parastrephiae]